MIAAMRQEPTLMPPLELALTNAEGESWVLRISPGMERFIGSYARIAGLGPCAGGLLDFTRAKG
jgi:hypothetical protein